MRCQKRDPQLLEGRTGQVAEDVIEDDSPLQEQPTGDGRIEPSRDEAHGPTLGAERKATGAEGPLVKEEGFVVPHLDRNRHVRVIEPYAPVRIQGRAQPLADLLRRERVAARAASRDRIRSPLYQVAVELMPYFDDPLEVGRDDGVDRGEGVNAEDPAKDRRCFRPIGTNEDAAPAVFDVEVHTDALQGLGEVPHETPLKPDRVPVITA